MHDSSATAHQRDGLGMAGIYGPELSLDTITCAGIHGLVRLICSAHPRSRWRFDVPRLTIRHRRNSARRSFLPTHPCE
jgi:hypothetical protein